ncbi:MAG: hypothetical protein DMG97_14090 [Acidobacteria bacterium]|nr:MAG: hypothetical protein DMG97_14090 [Acidobacteriota bacterium]
MAQLRGKLTQYWLYGGRRFPVRKGPQSICILLRCGWDKSVPNLLNDGHDGSLATADQWLQTNLGPLLSSSDFQNNGLLVITFDEGNLTDLSNGGGHVATLVIGPQVKSGYQSTTLYQHESTMRLMLATLGINAFPGNAANAPSMGEFFK